MSYFKKLRPIAVIVVLSFLLQAICPPCGYAHDKWPGHAGGQRGPRKRPDPRPDEPNDPEPPPCDPPTPPLNQCREFPPSGKCTSVDPVYLYDGSFYYRHTDLEIPGRLPIAVSRAYDTRSVFNGMFGFGWSFNFHLRLFKMTDGTLLLKRGDNTRDTFTYNQTEGTYYGPLGVHETITINPDGSYTLTGKLGSQYHFDLNGLIVSMEDTNNNQLLLSYDPQGKLPIHGISPYANVPNPIVIGYDWRLVRIEEAQNQTPTGRYVEFTYNDDGRLTLAQDFTGRQVVYTYSEDGHGDLVSAQDPEGNIYEYTYQDHLMTTFPDAPGGCADSCSVGGLYTNTYDAQNRVIQQTRGNSVIDIEYFNPLTDTRTITKVYDDTTQQLLHTRYQYYQFDSDGYATKYTQQLGNQLDAWGGTEGDDIVIDYTYDSVTKELNQEITNAAIAKDYTYDAKGNILTEISALQDGTVITTTNTYDPIYNNITSQEISSSAETQTYRTEYSYDANGNLLEERLIVDESTTLTTSYSYTVQGDIETVTSPTSQVTTHEYNQYGFLTRVYDPSNPARQTVYTYDGLGNRTSVTDASSNTTTFTYDNLNRIVSITNPKDEQTIYTWEGANLVQIEEGKTVADPGQITKIYYDELNRKTSIAKIIDSVETTLVSYTFDSEGNILTTTDANGNTTTNEYDVLGRLTSTTVIASGSEAISTHYEYDKSNNLTRVTDANGNVTDYAYDYLNRLTSVIASPQGEAISTNYTYDLLGNVKTITDAESRTTTNTYDAAGRLTKVTDPLNLETIYEYDNNGNLTQKADANNQITEYAYDPYNQLTSVYYGGEASPLKTITFTYDDAGNMLTWQDGTYSATYGYDELNRVLSVTTSYPFGDKTVSYAYDRFGNRDDLTYPDALGAVDYEYDDLNRLISVQTPFMASPIEYSYDNASRLTKKTLPNSVYTDYTYDNANRLLSLVNNKSDNTVISSFTYTHDDVGNRLSMTTLEGGHTYQYDDTYRLTSADHPVSSDEAYTYDKVGNRQTSAAHTDWTYDDNNRLLSYNGFTFTYDDNGNTLTKAQGPDITAYTWDYENRLASVIASGSEAISASYEYGPFGKRLSKTVDGEVTYFLYSEEDIIVEYDSTGNIVASYLHGQGIDEVLSMTRGGNTYYYSHDGLGSVSELTDVSQNIVESYKYDSFGNLQSASAIGSPYSFTGRRFDEETGLYYYRMRYYDSTTGRFLTEDPIGLMGGNNFYNYVSDNPINFIDSHGLFCEDLLAIPIKWERKSEKRVAKKGDWALVDADVVLPDPRSFNPAAELKCYWQRLITIHKKTTTSVTWWYLRLCCVCMLSGGLDCWLEDYTEVDEKVVEKTTTKKESYHTGYATWHQAFPEAQCLGKRGLLKQ